MINIGLILVLVLAWVVYCLILSLREMRRDVTTLAKQMTLIHFWLNDAERRRSSPASEIARSLPDDFGFRAGDAELN